jgi:hypothetical protein
MIKYVKGDLFFAVKDLDNFVIPHVVNTKGAWGAGFVIPLGNNFPEAKNRYLNVFNGQESEIEEKDLLGKTSFVVLDKKEKSFVANMFAQTLGGQRPLFYNHLSKCMDEVAKVAKHDSLEIHAPAFGSNLAGGDWNFIEQLIIDCWIKESIDVTIYYL